MKHTIEFCLLCKLFLLIFSFEMFIIRMKGGEINEDKKINP